MRKGLQPCPLHALQPVHNFGSVEFLAVLCVPVAQVSQPHRAKPRDWPSPCITTVNHEPTAMAHTKETSRISSET
eukprot:5713104-Amphidinium_carterae.1